jgi:hypothetical protein
MSLTFEQRQELRHAISEALRVNVETTCPQGKGNQSGYRYGCRCPDCTWAASKGRLSRRPAAA